MSFIAMLLYAPRYCLTASAGFRQQSKDCMPSVSLRSTLFAALATVNRRHFRRFLLFQSTKTSFVVRYRRYQSTKAQLHGAVCAADRASRSDDETGWRPADRACSNLMVSSLFHKPLKLTLYRPCLTGGSNKDRQPNQHRREVFFAQLFSLSVRRRRTKDVRFLESPSATRACR